MYLWVHTKMILAQWASELERPIKKGKSKFRIVWNTVKYDTAQRQPQWYLNSTYSYPLQFYHYCFNKWKYVGNSSLARQFRCPRAPSHETLYQQKILHTLSIMLMKLFFDNIFFTFHGIVRTFTRKLLQRRCFEISRGESKFSGKN